MLTIEKILSAIDLITFIGNKNTIINDVIQMSDGNLRDDVIYWCNDRNSGKLVYCKHGTIICSEQTYKSISSLNSCNYIIVANPRLTFAKILNAFFLPEIDSPTISANASIHSSVKIGMNVSVGAFTVIEKDCVIGDNCIIGSNNTIHKRTIVSSNVKIGSNNTIGGIGFGYEKNETGDYEVMHHIGNVVLHERVEIGNNTCIDRAVLGSTIINENVKIDNLVHISHGVVIGKNSLIIANAMLGGSCVIGENVWVSPSVSIINKGTVGNNALVGMGSVVVKPIEDSTVVVGNPAKFLKNI